MRAALLSVLLSTAAAAQGLLVLEPQPATTPAGSASRPLSLRRLEIDGGALPGTLGPLTVQLTASTPGGTLALAAAASAPWAPSVVVGFSAGQATSAPFFYRDPVPGDAGLAADAGPGWSAALRLTVSPVSLSADLEDGTLTDDEMPRGPFSGRIPSAPNTMAATPVAAHRGAWGIRFTDGDPASGGGPQGALAHDTAPMQGSYYVRSWVRMMPVTATGSTELLAIKSPQLDLSLLYVSYPGGGLYVGGYGASSTFIGTETDAGLVSGQWHLVELGLSGVGTAAGTRRAWLDGRPIASASVDLQGPVDRVTELALGQPWADDRGYVGAIDFDDARVSTEPPASTLALLGPSSLEVGACTPYQVALRTSDGASAAAPYPLDVQVGALSAEASAHADATCGAAGGGVTVPTGAGAAPVWLRARRTGAMTLRAVHPDFLPGTLTATGTPGPLRLFPSSAQLRAGERLDFDALGGTGPYAFSVTSSSGATVSAQGSYRAGADGGVDVVEVSDAVGAKASSLVTVSRSAVAPRFLAPPAQLLECEQPYVGSPRVDGDSPLAFTAQGLPPGMTLDAATGALAWTPARSQAGRWPLSLAVTGPGGADSMQLELSVRCAALERGCGCDSAPAGLVLLSLVAAWRRRARR